mmetsp:Transcript_32684/g.58524  ORF Transcript_32684/g.58524 Transcript_32684/m.58524 type:complete len:209 (-) Transcript_32684:1644-2270(-)
MAISWYTISLCDAVAEFNKYVGGSGSKWGRLRTAELVRSEVQPCARPAGSANLALPLPHFLPGLEQRAVTLVVGPQRLHLTDHHRVALLDAPLLQRLEDAHALEDLLEAASALKIVKVGHLRKALDGLPLDKVAAAVLVVLLDVEVVHPRAHVLLGNLSNVERVGAVLQRLLAQLLQHPLRRAHQLRHALPSHRADGENDVAGNAFGD